MNIICRFTILSLISILCAGPKVCRAWSMSSNEFKDTDFLKMRSSTDSMIFLTNAGNSNIDQRLMYSCNVCGNGYTWISSLRRHQLQCGNKEAKISCYFCTKKFYRRDRLKQHLITYHTNLLDSKR